MGFSIRIQGVFNLNHPCHVCFALALDTLSLHSDQLVSRFQGSCNLRYFQSFITALSRKYSSHFPSLLAILAPSPEDGRFVDTSLKKALVTSNKMKMGMKNYNWRMLLSLGFLDLYGATWTLWQLTDVSFWGIDKGGLSNVFSAQ